VSFESPFERERSGRESWPNRQKSKNSLYACFGNWIIVLL
jgi:hypothetical protein